MEVNYIRVTPDQLGYKDRGILKWQGLMLSAHTDQLKQINEANATPPPTVKPEQSKWTISFYLQQSFLRQKPISIQANTLNNGQFYPDVYCIVQGIKGKYIYLTLHNQRTTSCTIDQIRHIEYLKPKQWYDKQF